MRRMHIIAISLLFSFFFHIAAAEEAQKNERFQRVDETIIIDSHSGLMWAAQDNGQDIDWYDADRYCEEFAAGGYTDWRLPDLEELATLYTGDRKNKDGLFIAEPFTVTDCCMWSSDISMGGSSIFSYKSGKKPFAYMRDSYQLRALPVRGTKRDASHE